MGKQSVIGVRLMTVERHGVISYAFMLVVNRKEVEHFHFVDEGSRDRTYARLQVNPLPWFAPHVDNIEDIADIVAVPDLKVEAEALNYLKDEETGELTPLDDQQVEDSKLGLCVNCSNKHGAYVYHVRDEGEEVDRMVKSLEEQFLGPMKENFTEGMTQEEAEQMTPEIMKEIATYSVRLVRDRLEESKAFAIKVHSEVSRGIRRPLGTTMKIPTIESMAVQTDGSGYPMLPDEIRDWLDETRAKYNCPNVVKELVHGGETMENQMTMEEMVVFCMYVEKQHPGAGAYIFGGELVK
jgi:hypothetical protein